MRRRLIDATLHCLTHDGYAATTVSSIVRRAGVSRGAHLHHFPTKNALILEATEYLMRRAYRVLGEMLLAIAEDADRVAAVVDGAWKAIYGTRPFGAYFELITATAVFYHVPDLHDQRLQQHILDQAGGLQPPPFAGGQLFRRRILVVVVHNFIKPFWTDSNTASPRV